MAANASDYVVLRGGLAVPVAPARLLLELEARGIRLRRDGDDVVLEPRGQITEAERAALRLWKRHVLVLLDYTAEATVQ